MPHLGIVRRLLFALSVAAFATPFLFYPWIHGSYERYIWLIHQGFPCSSMGGGPFQLFVLGAFPWLLALALLAAALLTARWDAKPGHSLARGLALGAGLVAVQVAVMFASPRLFAGLLGCLN